jgi:hypothetical protein
MFQCKELYIHAGLLDSTYTIFPFTTEQFQKLINFLLGNLGSDKIESPLPLRATSKNRWRWSPWDAIAQYHIFRDKYERRFSPNKPRPNWRSSNDWPEIADDFTSLTRCIVTETARLLTRKRYKQHWRI